MNLTVSAALQQLFEDLAGRRLFLVYILTPNDKGGTDKIPIDPTRAPGQPGYLLNAQVEANRMTADDALAWVHAGFGAGVGLFIAEDAGLFFLDIDHCRDGDSWLPYASNLLSRFPGCYVEVSQSGTGLHVLGRRGPVPEHRTRNKEYRLEFYTRLRFCALTGAGAYGSILAETPPGAVEAFIATFVPPKVNDDVAPDWTTGPVEDWRGPTDDVELLRRALASKSANAIFGGGLTFADVWYATPAYENRYGSDKSGGDQALANFLAFWTGNDCDRMWRLMQQSGLVRDKWARFDNYIKPTILDACATQKTWYAEAAPLPAVDGSVASAAPGVPSSVAPALPPPGASVTQLQPQPVSAGTVGANPIPAAVPPGPLTADSMPYPDLQSAVTSLLSRFVFLRSENKYYERATRVLIGPEALNRSEASRMPRKDDGSGGRHKACDTFDLCPTKTECVGEGYAPGYADIYTEPGGLGQLVNTYRAPAYDRLEPTDNERALFQQYLGHLFPDGSEWLETYLDGLAFLLANPRGRLGYMTVLTGTLKGTGKSLLMLTIPRLLFGILNVSSPDASAVKHTFTDYLHHKRIVCFDELFEGDDDEAEARMNGRSAWITDDHSLPVHPKGKKAYEARPNVVTFFGTSNYPRKAVFLPPDDRRYALEETHATELPEWLKEQFVVGFLNSGRAPGVLASILGARDLSRFDPKRRPKQNAARVAAQQASLTSVQQELAAAWRDGDMYRDFDTVANIRALLFGRGMRHIPSDFRLAQELQGVLASVGAPCVRHHARLLLGGAYVRVWVWRNLDRWLPASAPQLVEAHAQFKTAQL